MKMFAVGIDENMERTLDQLKAGLGKASRAEVFRTAIALLHVALEAHENGGKLTVADQDDQVRKELVLPWAIPAPARMAISQRKPSTAAATSTEPEDALLSR